MTHRIVSINPFHVEFIHEKGKLLTEFPHPVSDEEIRSCYPKMMQYFIPLEKSEMRVTRLLTGSVFLTYMNKRVCTLRDGLK